MLQQIHASFVIHRKWWTRQVKEKQALYEYSFIDTMQLLPVDVCVW